MAPAAAAAQQSAAADDGLLPSCGADKRRIIQDVGEEAPLAGSVGSGTRAGLRHLGVGQVNSARTVKASA
jgi:hypothetical protein